MKSELILVLPLIIGVIGMLVYLLSTHGKVSELGRLAFWVGLLAWLLAGAKL